MMELVNAGSYNSVLKGVFSMIAEPLSDKDPRRMDSETNVFRFFAIANASSIFLAYCKISLATMEIGVAALVGISDLAALIVTVRPFSFIPETVPIIPAQEIIINLYPFLGLMKLISL